MLAEGLEFLHGLVQGLRSFGKLQVHKKDVFAHFPLGGAGLDPAHVQAAMGKTSQGLEQGTGLVGLQREGQAGQLPFPIALPLAEQQKAGAVARHIINGIGQLLEPVLLRGLLGGDGGAEMTPGHHPGRLGGGAGGQLQGIGQVVAQPEAALRQSLGVGEHFTDPLDTAATH